jgi:hypothetical protein
MEKHTLHLWSITYNEVSLTTGNPLDPFNRGSIPYNEVSLTIGNSLQWSILYNEVSLTMKYPLQWGSIPYNCETSLTMNHSLPLGSIHYNGEAYTYTLQLWSIAYNEVSLTMRGKSLTMEKPTSQLWSIAYNEVPLTIGNPLIDPFNREESKLQ